MGIQKHLRCDSFKKLKELKVKTKIHTQIYSLRNNRNTTLII